MNFQDAGQPKPGAAVLVDGIPMSGGGAHVPLLITQNYGRGRTAIFATGGSWRWQMLQPVADKSHEMFYQQLLRWLVADTPRKRDRVDAAAPDRRRIPCAMRAEVRDRTYLPASDATGGGARPGAGRHRRDRGDAARSDRSGRLHRGLDHAQAGVLSGRSGGQARGTEELGRDTHDVPPRGRRRREFPYGTESRIVAKDCRRRPEAVTIRRRRQPSSARISVIRKPASRCARPGICGTCPSCSCCCYLRSGEWLLRRKWGVI